MYTHVADLTLPHMPRMTENRVIESNDGNDDDMVHTHK